MFVKYPEQGKVKSRRIYNEAIEHIHDVITACHVPEGLCPISMNYNIEYEREEDGRWIAEAPQIPGALAYGDTQQEAISKVESLVLRILADRLDHGEMAPELEKVFTVAA